MTEPPVSDPATPNPHDPKPPADVQRAAEADTTPQDTKQAEQPRPQQRPAKRRRRWPFVLGGLAAVIVIAVLLFQWDWLIPMVNARASAALGRPVSIEHLHVKLGRVTHIVADNVTLGNPPDWQGEGPFATAEHLSLDVDLMTYIKSRRLVLPSIVLDKPVVDAQQTADGKANWNFGSSDSSGNRQSSDNQTDIGQLVINDGQVRVRSAKLAADFQVALHTADTNDGKGQIVASAKGTYAKQPITAEFTGGALLSLRDTSHPYPVNLKLANGPTRVSLAGTVQNPLSFAGADVTLEFAGPDMSLLLPLTGIAIPKTPPYRIAGKLDYAAGVVKFMGATGRVGSSDLNGNLEIDTKGQRPVLNADLNSKLVDLKDLGGFIGAEPGDASKGTRHATRDNGRLLPNDPLSIPKLTVADVHLKYRATRIQGQRQPLDNMRAALDIVDGNVHLHPLSFGIGRGEISGNIEVAPRGNALHAKATIDFRRVDIDKLLAASGAGRGFGGVGGRAVIDGTGRSIADILAHGDGELKLYMGAGGNVSALLVDLSGLQLGNALLSALGIPQRERIECFITDFALKQGQATSRLTLLDTEDSRTGLTGGVDLRNESLSLTLRTETKHFSVGSLPAPIHVGGTLASPGVMPDVAELGTRAGAAVGLGIAATPLAALLPTIQLGIGEDNACSSLLRSAATPPAAATGVPARRPANHRRRR